jgi:hypothetical protein
MRVVPRALDCRYDRFQVGGRVAEGQGVGMLLHRRVVILVAVATALVAFAAFTFTANAAPVGVQHNPTGIHGGYVLPPGLAHRASAAPGGAPATTCADGQGNCSPPLLYNGGPIMTSSIAHAIFWAPSGSSFPTGYQALVEQYFNDVAADSGHAGNPYGVAPQYTDTVGGTHHANYSVSFAGSITDTHAYPGITTQCHNVQDLNSESACIWDDTVHHEIASEVSRVVAANGLPIDNTNIYFVFFPPGVASCDDPAMSSCAYTAYCAYHEFGDGSTKPLYANMPYPGDSSYAIPCYTPDQDEPNGNVADRGLSALSHEHIETITDPDGTGWFDKNGWEIGDECAYYWGSLHGSSPHYTNTINGHNYFIQTEYSNAVGGIPTHGCEQSAQLQAAFTPPLNATTTELSSFDASSSTDGEGTIASYDWDFGDGTAHGTGATPTHQYASVGTFPVTLTVTDNHGLVDRAIYDVGVSNTVKAPTTVVLASSKNPSRKGNAVTFTATVSSGSGTPTGSITFFDNGSPLGTKPLSGGHATLTTSSLTRGSHTITATYGGDANFTGSASDPLTQVVKRHRR